jgi:hypothetical protein
MNSYFVHVSAMNRRSVETVFLDLTIDRVDGVELVEDSQLGLGLLI